MKYIDIILPLLTTILGAALGYFFSRMEHRKKIAEAEYKENKAAEKAKHQESLSFYQMMAVNLHASHNAFIDQCRLRNRLLRLLGYDPSSFDWEILEETLSEAYERLDDRQRLLFDLIRGITEGTLYKRNNAMLKLLNKNPQCFRELSEFKDLQAHLQFWLDKFESILKTRYDFCLIYVGINEKKPFPEDIAGKVDEAIERIQKLE